MIVRKGITLGQGKPVICVPVVAVTGEEIKKQIQFLAEQGAAMIEWRADFFDALNDPDAVRALLDQVQPFVKNGLLLFTIRTKNQGGQAVIDQGQNQGGQAQLDEKLLANLQALAAGHEAVDLVDMEYLEFARPEKHLRRLKKQDCIVIASHHDFAKTPDEAILYKLAMHMYEDGADIAKIAVMPQGTGDVLRLLELTDAIHQDKPNDLLVTMSMGGIGSISRVCGEVFGSCITFGSVGASSAPGQIEADRLASMLDVLHDSLA